MSDLVRIRRALLSVSDKSRLLELARCLSEHDVEIISTGGTAHALREAGFRVTSVDEVTGFPEMLDGRVKTLHPKVHGALLGLRENVAHQQAMRAHGIEPIDLLCVNLYPFADTLRRLGASAAHPDHEHEIIEQIDIGGPAMLRSASKNFGAVTVLSDPAQYSECITELRAHHGATTLALRRRLAQAVFARTAQYDNAIAAWMAPAPDPQENGLPVRTCLNLERALSLRYGENPHQSAALYVEGPRGGVAGAKMLHGKPLSYNNLLDASAAWMLVSDLAQGPGVLAAAAIIKHTNPCGASIDVTGSLRSAFEKAYAGDPLAAYGGILALSRPVDLETAVSIADGQKFFEVILAPGFDGGSVELLGKRWANVRLLEVSSDQEQNSSLEWRSVSGGLLAQSPDRLPIDATQWRLAAGPTPEPQRLRDAAALWIICKHVKSNAIVIGTDGALLGAGAGQMDRVTSCRLATEKAGARCKGAIAASDAFFPFEDGPRVLIDAGVTMIVQPGGSKRDEETIRLCAQRGVTCMLTGERHFRH